MEGFLYSHPDPAAAARRWSAGVPRAPAGRVLRRALVAGAGRDDRRPRRRHRAAPPAGRALRRGPSGAAGRGADRHRRPVGAGPERRLGDPRRRRDGAAVPGRGPGRRRDPAAGHPARVR